MATRFDQIVAGAREAGVKPWVAVKEGLAEIAVLALADEPGAVLQGGAALHFVYGSPRLSADVDFVGDDVASALEERGPQIARAAAAWSDLPARWSLGRAGRLLRGKVTLEVDAARRLVLCGSMASTWRACTRTPSGWGSTSASSGSTDPPPLLRPTSASRVSEAARRRRAVATPPHGFIEYSTIDVGISGTVRRRAWPPGTGPGAPSLDESSLP